MTQRTAAQKATLREHHRRVVAQLVDDLEQMPESVQQFVKSLRSKIVHVEWSPTLHWITIEFKQRVEESDVKAIGRRMGTIHVYKGNPVINVYWK